MLQPRRCVMMALVHDLAEAQGEHDNRSLLYLELRHLIHDTVGDIAPRENIPKVEKRRLEAVRLGSDLHWQLLCLIRAADRRRNYKEAMHNFVHEMLHDSPAAQRMLALWKVGAHSITCMLLPCDLSLFTFGLSHLLHQEYEEGKTDEARFVKGMAQYSNALDQRQ